MAMWQLWNKNQKYHSYIHREKLLLLLKWWNFKIFFPLFHPHQNTSQNKKVSQGSCNFGKTSLTKPHFPGLVVTFGKHAGFTYGQPLWFVLTVFLTQHYHLPNLKGTRCTAFCCKSRSTSPTTSTTSNLSLQYWTASRTHAGVSGAAEQRGSLDITSQTKIHF